MPGEQPMTIWRPRRSPPPRWAQAALRRLRLIGLALAAAALIALGTALWRATGTPVTVVVNGQPMRLSTHRRTVGGAVRVAGVRPDAMAYVEPPAEAPLEPGMIITVGALRPVIVHADGQMWTVPTRQIDPRAIAAEAGIALAPADAVILARALRPGPAEIAAQPALAAVSALPRELRVIRAQTIIVREVDPLTGAETAVSFTAAAPSLGRALYDAGYVFYEGDALSLPLATPIDGPLELRVERALPVALIAEGRAAALRTRARTVADLLAGAGIALSGEDYSLPPPESALAPGLTVRVVRVEVQERDEALPLPAGTRYVPDPDLALDQQQVLDAGRDGVLAQRVRVRLEDGQEVSRVLVGEWTARAPRPRVVAYGTRIVIQTLETPYGPLQYWRHLRVLATSYSPLTAGSKQPGDPFFGLSATGTPVVRGIVATDPRVIPLGTSLYVPGYGTGRALDVGGAVKGFRIDLGYDDANLVLWNSWVDVYLLVPVPPPDEMVWILPGR